MEIMGGDRAMLNEDEEAAKLFIKSENNNAENIYDEQQHHHILRQQQQQHQSHDMDDVYVKNEDGENHVGNTPEGDETSPINQHDHIHEDQEDQDDASDEDMGYEAQQLQRSSDNNIVQQDNENDGEHTRSIKELVDDNQEFAKPMDSTANPNVWTLPAESTVCTLEEIRRGQVINKVAPNECPVLGCGKKINEMRAEPSPGTISSGLRTHVLFVHYESRRSTKKRKLGWSNKRRTQASPRKQGGMDPMSIHSSPSTSDDLDLDNQGSNNLLTGLNLSQKSRLSPQTSRPGSLLNKKVKQLAAKSQSTQMSSLQSLMQATGGSKLSPQPRPKSQDLTSSQRGLNQTTSSLFSILAGLTQQQQNQMNQSQQQPLSRNFKTAHGTNTINISQCSRNPINNRPVNSSLMSLLNEKISGNVASSLQTQLKKSLVSDQRNKIPTSTTRQNVPSPATSSHYQASTTNESISSFNNGSSILSSLCSGNGDARTPYDNALSINSFIESIATRTGSNIGSSGIAEAKKIIEKFTTSLICSSQTIADHYLAPFAGEVPQQKPEISPSDVMLAYKMMHKSHGQP